MLRISFIFVLCCAPSPFFHIVSINDPSPLVSTAERQREREEMERKMKEEEDRSRREAAAGGSTSGSGAGGVEMTTIADHSKGRQTPQGALPIRLCCHCVHHPSLSPVRMCASLSTSPFSLCDGVDSFFSCSNVCISCPSCQITLCLVCWR